MDEPKPNEQESITISFLWLKFSVTNPGKRSILLVCIVFVFIIVLLLLIKFCIGSGVVIISKKILMLLPYLS